jgi:hypothetical protein
VAAGTRGLSPRSRPSDGGKDDRDDEGRVNMYIGIGLGTLILIIVLIAVLT